MADPTAIFEEQITAAAALIAGAEPTLVQLRTDTQQAADDAARADNNVGQAGRRLANAAPDTREAAKAAYESSKEDADRLRDLYNRFSSRLTILETQMQQYQAKLAQATLAKTQIQTTINAAAAAAPVGGAAAADPAAAAAAAAAAAQAALPAAAAEKIDWSFYCNTKTSYQQAKEHVWSESCTPYPVIENLLQSLPHQNRMLPYIFGTYIDYCHGLKLSPGDDGFRTPSVISQYMTNWVANYQTANPDWATLNVAGAAADPFGLESLMIDNKLTKVGKVFFTAYYDEIKSLKGGKALAGGSSIPPIIAHHDESNVSCNPRMHMRLQE